MDLFSGIGGLTLGVCEAARRNGLAIRNPIAIELDPVFANSYSNTFRKLCPNVICGSVLDETVIKLVAGQQADVLVAGPPCQGHSDLNNKTRRMDFRNSLYGAVADYAELVQPSLILAENVQGVVHDGNQVVEATISRLKNLGYFVQTSRHNALEYGLPQSRIRHILLASKQPVATQNRPSLSRHSTLRDYIFDIKDEWKTSATVFRTPSSMTVKNKQRAAHLLENDLFDLPNDMRPDCHKSGNHSYKSMYGRLNWDKPAQTITSGFGSMGQGRYLHPEQQRTLTPHEAARIQGLPDYIDLQSIESRVKLSESIANAVPPPMAADILEPFIKSLLSTASRIR